MQHLLIQVKCIERLFCTKGCQINNMKKGFWNAQKPMEMSFKQLFKPMIGLQLYDQILADAPECMHVLDMKHGSAISVSLDRIRV